MFIETCIQSENTAPHTYIDFIGVPNDLELDVDLEVFFRKSFSDDDSEWSTHKKLIDTKAKKGQIWRCLPSTGTFSYVHVNFNNEGGFAHIIENTSKYTKNKALELLSGIMGDIVMNLNNPFPK